VKILMSTLLAAVVGGLTGLFVVTVFGQWYDGFFANLMAGGCVGLGCGVCLGGVMGMHSVSIGSAANQANGAMLWGLVTGLTYGLSLGPVLGGAVGILYALAAGGGVVTIMFGAGQTGLIVGPLVAILAWEAGFMLAKMDGPPAEGSPAS
jgi:hypothetical protein